MTDATETRKAFVQELKDDPRVKDVDFTRDCYKTVVLTLGDGGADDA